MATNLWNISDQIDIKYKIKRPTYSSDDLEELQKIILKEQKKNPKWMDFWLEDVILIRFLKANITVCDSFIAIKAYCEWRIKYDVDNISPDDDAVKKESVIGRDKYVEGFRDYCGRPVVVVYPRLHDSYHGDYDSVYKYIIYQLEQLCAECDRTCAGTFCLIFDLTGFSMRNMDYQCLKKIVWFMKNCYPERLGVCLIVNYSWLFYGCWEIIKFWLKDVTRSKIIFCGQKELNDFIDAERCPVQFTL